MQRTSDCIILNPKRNIHTAAPYHSSEILEDDRAARVTEPEAVNNQQNTLSLGHNKATAHISSQQLEQYIRNLGKPKATPIPSMVRGAEHTISPEIMASLASVSC